MLCPEGRKRALVSPNIKGEKRCDLSSCRRSCVAQEAQPLRVRPQPVLKPLLAGDSLVDKNMYKKQLSCRK